MLCRCALSSFLLLLVTGCQREASASPTRDTADPLAAVQLDGGKRWPVDDHTQKSLAAMQAAVQAAAADQSPPRTRALAQQLQGLADELIGGCKLTGPAHDAFHAYLGDGDPATPPAPAYRAESLRVLFGEAGS